MRKVTCRRFVARVSIVGFILVTEASAQTPPEVMQPPPRHTILFVHGQDAAELRQVVGAPFSARTETETVQTLAGGNRIVNKVEGFFARDGEGRTRREVVLATVGPVAVAARLAKTVVITDPVEGFTYTLDPSRRTARKLKLPAPPPESAEPGDCLSTFEVRLGLRGAAPGGPPGDTADAESKGVMTVEHSAEPDMEQLGTQDIEGVTAEGTRLTTVLPAGAVGNELPITVVSERWYSPELKTLILTLRSDPRFGETKYCLTHIERGDPEPSLFEVPADFTITEAVPFEQPLPHPPPEIHR